MNRLIRRKKYVDRSSPELRALGRRALDCLDASLLPEYAREERAGEVAICLKEILDRIEIPPYDSVPGKEAVEAVGGGETLKRWRIPGTRITIGRVEEGPQRHEYLFTPGTVARVVEYYEEMRYLPYRTTGPEVSESLYRWYFSSPGNPFVGQLVDRLPVWTSERKFGVTIWKWPGILMAALLAPLLMVWGYRLQQMCVVRWRDRGLWRYWLTLLFSVVAMLIPFGAKYAVEHVLTLRGMPLYVFSFFANLMAFLASLVVVFGVSSRVTETLLASPRIQPRGLDAQ
ncbi:MAG: hypothetical protein ACC645_01410, partial [Pirellulales bacterium]